MIAVLENYQEADGTVTIPEALRPYMDGLERLTRRAEVRRGLAMRRRVDRGRRASARRVRETVIEDRRCSRTRASARRTPTRSSRTRARPIRASGCCSSRRV